MASRVKHRASGGKVPKKEELHPNKMGVGSKAGYGKKLARGGRATDPKVPSDGKAKGEKRGGMC